MGRKSFDLVKQQKPLGNLMDLILMYILVMNIKELKIYTSPT